MLKSLKENVEFTLDWFETNCSSLHINVSFLITGYTLGYMSLDGEEKKICKSIYVKLLGITVDRELKFDNRNSIISILFKRPVGN